MKKLNKTRIMNLLLTFVASYAFTVALTTVNSVSKQNFHQPVLPESLKKYKKV